MSIIGNSLLLAGQAVTRKAEFVNSRTGTGSSQTSFSISEPTGAQPGDLLIVVLGANSGSYTRSGTTFSQWGPNVGRLQIFSAIRGAAASTFTATSSTTVSSTAAIYAVFRSGAATFTGTTTSLTTGAANFGSITLSNAAGLVLAASMADISSGAPTPTVPFTTIAQASGSGVSVKLLSNPYDARGTSITLGPYTASSLSAAVGGFLRGISST